MVPFVSRRSTGIVCGLVSAGGASGGVINQALFFLNTPAKGAYGARTPEPSRSSLNPTNFSYSIPYGVINQALAFPAPPPTAPTLRAPLNPASPNVPCHDLCLHRSP